MIINQFEIRIKLIVPPLIINIRSRVDTFIWLDHWSSCFLKSKQGNVDLDSYFVLSVEQDNDEFFVPSVSVSKFQSVYVVTGEKYLQLNIS